MHCRSAPPFWIHICWGLTFANLPNGISKCWLVGFTEQKGGIKESRWIATQFMFKGWLQIIRWAEGQSAINLDWRWLQAKSNCLVFFWNVYSASVIPFIDVNIMSPIATALSTLTVGWACIPVANLGPSWMGLEYNQCVFPVMCLSCCCHILPSVVVNPSELLHCLINFCTGRPWHTKNAKKGWYVWFTR